HRAQPRLRGHDVERVTPRRARPPGAGAPAPARRFAWGDLVPLGLVLTAAALVQGGALRAAFFADDYLFLDVVGHRSLGAALATPDPLGNFFRPVSRALWFWCVSHVGGASPLVFHLGNLGLLLAILALLFAIVGRVGGTWAATLASGVVALHYAADVPVWW